VTTKVVWKREGSYYLSTLGYTISKSLVNGVWIYELWELPDKNLGKSTDVNEVKKLHLDALKTKSTLPADPPKRTGKYR
jgi:hypothetical protein